MSVSDVPFNYNAQFDIKKLKVGIIQDSFDSITNVSAKANADKMLQTFRSIGVTQLVPIEVPVFPVNTGGFGAERAAYFDEHQRSGRMKGARSGGSGASARLIPAPEYLQQQRARMMMMMELAKATAHVDVYVVGSNNIGMSRPPAPPEGAPVTPPPQPRPDRVQSPTQRHFGYANLAGYPAINLPNGFADSGGPTNAVIYAQPFREMEILALAKAYQDAAGFHLIKPTKLDQATTTQQR
jgi:Asp-tRNA(Asn)/Glu-tRNA(Gln) amidotransferase A subunit family amidase